MFCGHQFNNMSASARGFITWSMKTHAENVRPHLSYINSRNISSLVRYITSGIIPQFSPAKSTREVCGTDTLLIRASVSFILIKESVHLWRRRNLRCWVLNVIPTHPPTHVQLETTSAHGPRANVCVCVCVCVNLGPDLLITVLSVWYWLYFNMPSQYQWIVSWQESELFHRMWSATMHVRGSICLQTTSTIKSFWAQCVHREISFEWHDGFFVYLKYNVSLVVLWSGGLNCMYANLPRIVWNDREHCVV